MPDLTNRALTDTQKAVLRALLEHGGTWDGTSWQWANRSGTVRVMEALLARGLVDRTVGGSRDEVTYTANERGRSLAQIVGARI